MQEIGIIKFQYAEKKPALETCIKYSQQMASLKLADFEQLIRSNYVSDVFDVDKIS